MAYDIRLYSRICCNASNEWVRSGYTTGSGTPQAGLTLSSNANLSGLTASTSTTLGGTYSALNIGTFSASTTSYTATVANAQTHAKLTPTVQDTGKATVTVDGTTVNSGSESVAIALSVGSNAITVRVTAQDSTTKDYTVTITRQQPPQSSNANLSGLTASTSTTLGGTYSALNIGTFSASTTSYTATVANAQTHAKLTPTVQDTGKATVTVDGTTVNSGSESVAIALSVGSNAITVRVTAQDSTTKDYTVTITRQAQKALPAVTLSASPNPVTEGSSVTVTATLSAALSSQVVIPVTVTDDSAELSDHGTLTGITIASGATRGMGTITTAQDADEDDETFTVALGSSLPSGVTAGTPNSVPITIRDDDGTRDTRTSVSLSASDSGRVLEGDRVSVTATLSASASRDVRIPVTFRNDTAEPGDYSSPRSYIAILGGKRTGTLSIKTNHDGDKLDETFTVALNTGRLPSGITAGSPGSVQITIHDDEASEDEEIHLWASPNPVPEGSSVTVRVLLYRGSGLRPTTVPYDVTVPVRVERRTSEEGDHGTLESITIPANRQSATGRIWTSRDADADDETFLVSVPQLRMESGFTRGTPFSALVTIREGGGGGGGDADDVPSTCSLAAPYWSGPTGGFTVMPAAGRTSVSVTCGGNTTEYSAENGVVTRLVRGSCPGGLRLEGAAPGGWYWQHGERNAAAAPFVCREDLGGPPAVVPGGVVATATDDATWFRHDTARLVGIVPHLAGNECSEYVSPYWQGDGGVVVRPAEGRSTAKVSVQCGATSSTLTASPGADGVAAELVRKDYCTDDEGEAKQGKLTVTGAAPGGWYWISGERNAAVAPLMCADLLGGPAAVDPGGVLSRATEDGTYFRHDADRLIGVVPHVAPERDE